MTAIASAFGVPRGVLVSLAPKSVTAGVAMAISEGLGREAGLTAVLVIATGLVGAVMVTPLMNALGIRDYAARGFAVGLASHGIGTARAFTADAVAGTFSGVAIGLSAVVTAIVAPLLLRLLRGAACSIGRLHPVPSPWVGPDQDQQESAVAASAARLSRLIWPFSGPMWRVV